MRKSATDGNSSNFKRGTAIEDICYEIKQMISHNQLAPGQKLIYADLAQQVKSSTTPVIQALNRLETEGFVKYVANKGYFVKEITEKEARQLYQAREALELYIIPSVINNLDSNKLREIREVFKKYGNADSRTLLILDIEFHLKIVQCANNDVIYKLLRDIFERIYFTYKSEYLEDYRIRNVKKEHKRLFSALKEGNLEAAIEETRNHIRSGMDHIVSGIRRSQERHQMESILFQKP